MPPSIDSTDTVITTASNNPSNVTQNEGNAMQQLLEEVRQLRQEQGKFIEVMKEMLKVKEGEDKPEILRSGQPGKSRNAPSPGLFFWEGILSTEESLNEGFDGFMSWLRGPGSSRMSRNIAVERPSVQFSIKEEGREKWCARALEGLSDDEFSNLKTTLQQHWPQNIPDANYFELPGDVLRDSDSSEIPHEGNPGGRKLDIRDEFYTFDYEHDLASSGLELSHMLRSLGV